MDQVGDEGICTLLEDNVRDAIHSHGFVGAELGEVAADLALRDAASQWQQGWVAVTGWHRAAGQFVREHCFDEGLAFFFIGSHLWTGHRRPTWQTQEQCGDPGLATVTSRAQDVPVGYPYIWG